MVVSPFIGLGLGCYALYIGNKWANECNKYAFENTTDGGVLKFKSYEESKTYNRKRNLSKLSPFLFISFSILGLMIWK